MFILKWLDKIFSTTSYQDSIDSYIAGRQPKNAADIEHLIKQYHYNYIGRKWI
jgi:hypothetical protein